MHGCTDARMHGCSPGFITSLSFMPLRALLAVCYNSGSHVNCNCSLSAGLTAIYFLCASDCSAVPPNAQNHLPWNLPVENILDTLPHESLSTVRRICDLERDLNERISYLYRPFSPAHAPDSYRQEIGDPTLLHQFLFHSASPPLGRILFVLQGTTTKITFANRYAWKRSCNLVVV